MTNVVSVKQLRYNVAVSSSMFCHGVTVSFSVVYCAVKTSDAGLIPPPSMPSSTIGLLTTAANSALSPARGNSGGQPWSWQRSLDWMPQSQTVTAAAAAVLHAGVVGRGGSCHG